MGVDVDDDSVADKSGEGVVDLMSTKESALRLAVDAAVTVLRVRVDCCCWLGAKSVGSSVGCVLPLPFTLCV